jgi:hypothetical protein
LTREHRPDRRPADRRSPADLADPLALRANSSQREQ